MNIRLSTDVMRKETIASFGLDRGILSALFRLTSYIVSQSETTSSDIFFHSAKSRPNLNRRNDLRKQKIS
jgi:hypothetical protein